jgi:hypothetical protein
VAEFTISTGASGKAMTLAELRAFMAQAAAAGATGSEVPKVTATIGGRIKQIELVIVNPIQDTGF